MRNKKIIYEQVTIDLERAVGAGCFSDYNWFKLENKPQPHTLADGTLVVTGKNEKGQLVFFYGDGTVVNQVTGNKKTWKCDKLSASVSRTADPKKMSVDQEAYVDGIVKTEGVQKEKPSDYEIDKSAWDKIDLNTRNPKLFPIPGIFFVYKKASLLNVSSPQQEEIIKRYTEQGWEATEPNATEIGLYRKRDMRELYPEHFKTSYFMWQPWSTTDVKQLMQKVETSFDSQFVSKKQCKTVIKTIYLAAKKGVSFPDDAVRIEFVDYAKRCLRQNEVPRSVRDEKNALLLLNKKDKLYIGENSNLDNIIKKSLMEASENKKRLIQEEKIISSRFNFILENIEPKTKQGREEIYMNILSEMIYLNIQGFNRKVISEQVEGVFGVLSNLFGRSTSAIADSFKEKGVEWIVEKLGFGGNSYMKNFLITSLGNVNIMDIPKLFTDCEFLTKKIAETIPEAYLRKLEYQKGIGGMFTDVVRNTLYDVIRESSFAQKLESSIAKIVCPLVTKLTGMFSNKLSGMKTKLVGA